MYPLVYGATRQWTDRRRVGKGLRGVRRAVEETRTNIAYIPEGRWGNSDRELRRRKPRSPEARVRKTEIDEREERERKRKNIVQKEGTRISRRGAKKADQK